MGRAREKGRHRKGRPGEVIVASLCTKGLDAAGGEIGTRRSVQGSKGTGARQHVHARSGAANARGQRRLHAISRVAQGGLFVVLLLVVAGGQRPSLPPAVGIGLAGNQLRAHVVHLPQRAPPLFLCPSPLLPRLLPCGGSCLAWRLAWAGAAAAAHTEAAFVHGRDTRHLCKTGRRVGTCSRHWHRRRRLSSPNVQPPAP